MFSSRRYLVFMIVSLVLLAGCGRSSDNIVNFGPWSISLDQTYENQYVEAEDIGNAVEKVLAFRQTQEEDEDTKIATNTIVILKLNQYSESHEGLKNAFAKNYQSLVGFSIIEDKSIKIDCDSQKATLFQFSYSENPLSESLMYISQLYLSDTEQKQSYMLSHLTQQKKSAKALIKQMKGIACREVSEE